MLFDSIHTLATLALKETVPPSHEPHRSSLPYFVCKFLPYFVCKWRYYQKWYFKSYDEWNLERTHCN